MVRRWGLAVVWLVCGGVLAAQQLATAHLRTGALVIVGVTALAALISPLTFPRPLTAAEAQHRSAQDGHAVIYWRPGCVFCMRLRATLGRDARRAHWVDIWHDPGAAAAVRAVAGGNETVPTVILAGTPYVNPNPSWLRTRLREQT